MTASSDLRAVMFEAYGPFCEWPIEGKGNCPEKAVELAHITSKGMGGSKHRDTPQNSFVGCWLHARISDGEGAGNRALELKRVDVREHILALLRVTRYPYSPNVGTLAWHMGEALRDYLVRARPYQIEWSPEDA